MNILNWERKIHKLYHSFCDHLGKKYFNLEPRLTPKLQPTKLLYKHFEPKKFVGHEASAWAEKFIKKNPEILIVSCDDDYHCSSDIYLIPHEDKKGYWGTTIMFVPQCCDIQNTFFESHIMDDAKTNAIPEVCCNVRVVLHRHYMAAS